MNCYMPHEVPPQLGPQEGEEEAEEATECEHDEPEGDIDELHPYHARGDGRYAERDQRCIQHWGVPATRIHDPENQDHKDTEN